MPHTQIINRKLCTPHSSCRWIRCLLMTSPWTILRSLDLWTSAQSACSKSWRLNQGNIWRLWRFSLLLKRNWPSRLKLMRLNAWIKEMKSWAENSWNISCRFIQRSQCRLKFLKVFKGCRRKSSFKMDLTSTSDWPLQRQALCMASFQLHMNKVLRLYKQWWNPRLQMRLSQKSLQKVCKFSRVRLKAKISCLITSLQKACKNSYKLPIQRLNRILLVIRTQSKVTSRKGPRITVWVRADRAKLRTVVASIASPEGPLTRSEKTLSAFIVTNFTGQRQQRSCICARSTMRGPSSRLRKQEELKSTRNWGKPNKSPRIRHQTVLSLHLSPSPTLWSCKPNSSYSRVLTYHSLINFWMCKTCLRLSKPIYSFYRAEKCNNEPEKLQARSKTCKGNSGGTGHSPFSDLDQLLTWQSLW